MMHHSLTIDQNVCRGCTHCMKQCPTQAIRIHDGHAHVLAGLCINCGQCLRACPHGAIRIEQTPFEEITSYKIRVAVVPAVFFAQFPDAYSVPHICQALYRLGFTHLLLAESGVDILNQIRPRNIPKDDLTISNYCPAVMKLIQMRYPLLLDNITVRRPPSHVISMFIRSELIRSGINDKEIGIFYFTPCAAKIAQIKTSGSDESKLFQGGINMDTAYNKVREYLSIHKTIAPDVPTSFSFPACTSSALLWSTVKGECIGVTKRAMAVDEMHNVIEFLEQLEEDENTNLNYLELDACAEGCAGGVLTVRNRFLANERLRHWAQSLPSELDDSLKERIEAQRADLEGKLETQRPEASEAMTWDTDTAKAIHKMENSRMIAKALPGIDCGLCGAPTCKALADDIARSEASIRQCVVLKLKDPKMMNQLSKIWGERTKG
ncbi:MAG: [Fe-Fe] hydrogenase large subunit C-terminal domain-containing protein, partial [Sphaerochaetaceae bacterium]